MTPQSAQLDRHVEALLDGRVDCWHHHLNGQISQSDCRVAALHFIGYDCLDHLITDYPERERAPLDPHNFPERWQQWLLETDGVKLPAQRQEALFALTLFMAVHNIPYFEISFGPGRNPGFFLRKDDVKYSLPISTDAASALSLALGCPTCPTLLAQNNGYHLPSPVGPLEVSAHLIYPPTGFCIGVQLTARAIEHASDQPCELAKPFLYALRAKGRADRAQEPSLARSPGRSRTRA